MTYEVWSTGGGKWEVRKNGVAVTSAFLKRIEVPEGHRDLPNGGREYYVAGPSVGTVRLPNGEEVTNVAIEFP